MKADLRKRGITLETCADAVRLSARSWSPKGLARRTLERHAQALIDSNGAVDLGHLTGATEFAASVPGLEGRHEWSLHASDQLVLQAIVSSRRVQRAFEIGTFNGGTTRLLAEHMSESGRVWTLDLPPRQFDHTQEPAQFAGIDVGVQYRKSTAAHRVTQILQDSTEFTPGALAGTMDLVLVDGAHDYEHGVCDTRTAFELIAPHGLIVWDDFNAYWHGLVRGVYEAAGVERAPRRLAGSNLGVWFSGIDQS